jgi:hypothetical protein
VLSRKQIYVCSKKEGGGGGSREDPPARRGSRDRWVGEQRACKKALDCGEPSKDITAARAAKLENFGFAWELSAAALSKWISKGARGDAGLEARLAKLKAYRSRHGDVLFRWAEDPGLGL